jgi:hypothetical protein
MPKNLLDVTVFNCGAKLFTVITRCIGRGIHFFSLVVLTVPVSPKRQFLIFLFTFWKCPRFTWKRRPEQHICGHADCELIFGLTVTLLLTVTTIFLQLAVTHFTRRWNAT